MPCLLTYTSPVLVSVANVLGTPDVVTRVQDKDLVRVARLVFF